MLRLIAVVAALSLGSILLGLGLSTNLDPARSVDDAALIEGAGEGQDAIDSDQPESADESDGEGTGGEDQVSNESETEEGEAAGAGSGEELAETGDQSEGETDGEGGLTVTRSNPPSPDPPR